MNQTISVIIPTYQHADVLGDCLEHLFAQTLQPLEILVVNDGSTDNTDEVVKPYQDRIRYITQENQGNQRARMRGLEESKGDLVIFCDADVLMKPAMLEKLKMALESHKGASYAYSSFKFGWKTFQSFPFDPDRLKKLNYIHTSALIRRHDFPGFDFNLKKFQDWDVWLTMLQEGKTGVFVDEVLFHVLVDKHRGGISNWMPSFMYQWPLRLLGYKKDALRKYEQGVEIIKKKHNLT